MRFLTLPSVTGGRGFTLEYIYRPFTGETTVPARLGNALGYRTAYPAYGILTEAGLQMAR